MDKKEIKNNKTKIIQEWSDFYRDNVDNVDNGEEYIKTTDENYKRFGEMMYKVIYELGGASNQMWISIYPSGTEDKTWYRLFHKKFIDTDCKINFYGPADSYMEVYMLMDLVQAGVISKLEFAKTLDWRKIK